MLRISLSHSEVSALQGLLHDLASRYQSAEDMRFLEDACVIAQDLPKRLRVSMNEFKLKEPEGICIISGYPVDEAKVGKTPPHWKWRNGTSPALEEEMLLVLFGSLLGDVFGWGTQQDGHIVHDVIPIKGHEHEQLGTSSEELLTWHIEDAFHPYRGDYICMMCLRNRDNVATTVASIDAVKLKPEHVKVLFEPRFPLRPDESHLEKNKSELYSQAEASDDLVRSAFNRINEINTHPEKLPVLFGDPQSPYLRIDPYFMEALHDDDEAQQALDALIQAVDSAIYDLVLQAGEFCFLDNYRVVHGRKQFKARFDGNDRWLKRINVTKDLRKSRNARLSCESRIIY
ncbi:MAG: guanitoxin biosynthesis L-enduracididine beta-hydroxylase GntD [Pyrinomonadaceae bacterium]